MCLCLHVEHAPDVLPAFAGQEDDDQWWPWPDKGVRTVNCILRMELLC